MLYRLTCANGHAWELTLAADAATFDAELTCPTCGAKGRVAPGGAASSATLSPATSGAPASPSIPGFEILRELGRGGMGVVYLARQLKLDRLVALKMILAGGHAAERDRARFLAEANAVARLQHENIVQIFEIGEADGRPFFSLEYVEGGSLADRLDGTPWPARDAALVLVPLARAIHYAHTAGIVHRDLKPANILLSAECGVRNAELKSRSSSIPNSEFRIPSLKVTDFGLAKNMGSADGPTQSGAILGTPSYMAPEQAGGQTRHVGPAADVYALGAILYELLTGRPPFRAETPLDTILQVVNQEPVRPSQLTAKCPRDLETICLKCLQKEPAKRYAAASDLADDLRRFLDGEPIRARPVGPLGRSWRWARRNPAVAGLLAVLFTVLLTGFVIVFALWRRAERESGHRLVQEARAKANLHKAVQAVDAMLTRVADERLAYVPQFEGERRQILEDAVRFYADFLSEEADDPELRREMGRAYFRLGNVFMSLGRARQALDALSQATRLQERLADEFPDEPAHQNDLANTLLKLAATHRMLDDAGGAEPHYLRSSRIAEGLVAKEPSALEYRVTLAEVQSQLGFLHFQMQRVALAKTHYEKSLSEWEHLMNARPDEFSYSLSHGKALGNLAFFQQNLRNYEPSERNRRRQITELEGLLKRHPERRREIDPMLADARLNLGAILTETNRAELAGDLLPQGMAVYERLVNDYPLMPMYRLRLALGHQTTALQGRLAQRPEQAEQSLHKAIVLLEELDKSNPDAFYHGLYLRQSYVELGQLHQRMGKTDSAVKLAEKSVAHAREDAGKARATSMVQFDLTRQLQLQANMLGQARRNADAIKSLDEAMTRMRTLHHMPSASPELQSSRTMRVLLMARGGDRAGAAQELAALTQSLPSDPTTLYNLACAFAQVARGVRADTATDAATRAERVQEALAKAGDLIRKLAADGYFKPPARVRGLWNDSDLEPLRSDATFKQWLDEHLPAPKKSN